MPEQTSLGLDPFIHFPSLTFHGIALVQKARAILKANFPEFREKAYPVWKGIGYSDPKAGYLCALFPQPEMLKLGFEWGVLLNDPQGRLRGTGKQVRYLEFLRPEDILAPVIVDFVNQSKRLPSRKSEKLFLIESVQGK